MVASRFTGTSPKTVLMCKTHVYCHLSYPGRGPHHPGNYQGIIRELSGNYLGIIRIIIRKMKGMNVRIGANFVTCNKIQSNENSISRQ